MKLAETHTNEIMKQRRQKWIIKKYNKKKSIGLSYKLFYFFIKKSKVMEIMQFDFFLKKETRIIKKSLECIFILEETKWTEVELLTG